MLMEIYFCKIRQKSRITLQAATIKFVMVNRHTYAVAVLKILLTFYDTHKISTNFVAIPALHWSL